MGPPLELSNNATNMLLVVDQEAMYAARILSIGLQQIIELQDLPTHVGCKKLMANTIVVESFLETQCM